jgi:hypothetical protein
MYSHDITDMLSKVMFNIHVNLIYSGTNYFLFGWRKGTTGARCTELSPPVLLSVLHIYYFISFFLKLVRVHVHAILYWQHVDPIYTLIIQVLKGIYGKEYEHLTSMWIWFTRVLTISFLGGERGLFFF